MSRPSPISSPYQSDDEESFHYNNGGENEAVQGLLGMVAMQASSGLLEREEDEEDFGWWAVAEM